MNHARLPVGWAGFTELAFWLLVASRLQRVFGLGVNAFTFQSGRQSVAIEDSGGLAVIADECNGYGVWEKCIADEAVGQSTLIL